MVDFNSFLFETIKSNGGVSVAVAGLIEQVIVPIPSPVIPMAAGFIFVPRQLTGFWPVFKDLLTKAALPFAIGSTIGSTMVYLASWFGGKFLINKFSKWLEITWSDVELIKKKYFHGNAWDEVVIFASRAIPVLPSVLFSAVCGAMRIPAWDFYLFTFLGLLIRGLLLGWLGWQSGEALFAISEGLDQWETIITVVFIIAGFGLLVWAYLQRKKWLKNLRSSN